MRTSWEFGNFKIRNNGPCVLNSAHAGEGMERAAAAKPFHRSGGHCVIKIPGTMIQVEVCGKCGEIG